MRRGGREEGEEEEDHLALWGHEQVDVLHDVEEELVPPVLDPLLPPSDLARHLGEEKEEENEERRRGEEAPTWLVMAACSSLLADLTPCWVMNVFRIPVSVF